MFLLFMYIFYCCYGYKKSLLICRNLFFLSPHYALQHLLVIESMTKIDSIGDSEAGQEDWRSYVNLLEHYIVANDIADPSKKQPVLLSVLWTVNLQADSKSFSLPLSCLNFCTPK